jgi:hypothetical protein
MVPRLLRKEEEHTSKDILRIEVKLELQDIMLTNYYGK